MPAGLEGDELNTWPQIAEALGVSVRTAQKYEQSANLPVYRIAGGEKARVWAYRSELIAWRHKSAVGTAAEPSGAQAGHPAATIGAPTRPVGRWWIAAAAFGVALLAVAWSLARPEPEPAGFRTAGNDLVILDAHGRDMWRHSFPRALDHEAYTDNDHGDGMVRFFDINGDGHAEVLVNYQPVDWQTGGTSLYCFSRTGKLLWQFVPGRPLRDRSQYLEPFYFARETIFLPSANPALGRIVTTGIHARSHPSEVAILDPSGHVTGEYWHSGHIPHVAAADIDGDGVPEILVAGVADGYNQATLVALDSRHVAGASTQPEGDHRQIQGLPTGSEKVVILFPKTCVTKRMAEHNRAVDIRLIGDTIQVFVMEDVAERHPRQPYIIYTFERRLKLINVTVSDQFVSYHKTLEGDGRLDHAWTPAEAEALYNVVVLRPHPGPTAVVR